MAIKKDGSISEIMENVNKFITNRWDVFYTVDITEYKPFGAGVLDGYRCGVLVEYLLKKHSKDDIDIIITEWVVKGDSDDIKIGNFKNMGLDSLESTKKKIYYNLKC